MTLHEHDVLQSAFSLEHHLELGRLLHLRALLVRGHRHVVVRELARHAPESVLPERRVLVRTVDGQHQRRVIAEVDGALVLLKTWRADATLVVSADDEALAQEVADEIAARVPQPIEDDRVEVTFSDACSGPRTVDVDVRPWRDIADHYPDAVRAALEALTSHRPDVASARRLVLWHGAPAPARRPPCGRCCTRGTAGRMASWSPIPTRC